MAAVSEAPQQFNQPSRKGKKAWRKNVDISEVQKGLQQLRDEEIEGGVLAEKPSEELFTFDTTGSESIRKAQSKKGKPLKCDEILAKRSAIQPVDTRKRPNSKVTDGIIQPNSKRQKSDWVTHKEWLRLKKVAKEANPEIINTQDLPSYDPWADDGLSQMKQTTDSSKFSFLPEKKPIVAPSTLKQPPISLAVNGKPIPSVKNPDAGTSYNPAFEDWDRLLTKEGEKEVAAERERLEEEKIMREKRAKIEAAKYQNEEAQADDESAWEGFESEYEGSEWLHKKRPERKTQAQRNKIKRRKEAERKAKWEEQMKKRDAQAAEVQAIAESFQEKEANKNQLEKQEDNSEEGDDEILRKKQFRRRNPVPEKPLEVVLPDELQDSLRLLKPEGNLLGDRFRTLLVQGKLEARKPITQPKKAKKEYTEKWTHKDFKI